MISLIILSTILTTAAIAMGTQFFSIIFRGFAPFISTKGKVIDKILCEINCNNGNANVYELGCGKAGFLRSLEKKMPEWKFIGIEYSFWVWLIAKIQISLSHSKIKIIRNNLFDVNLADADLIYCYLNINMMEKLEKKFKQECKPGAKIISYCFSMPNLEPEKVIKMDNGGKIYFYRI